MPFISDWIEPEVLVDDPEKRIQIRRAYDGQTSEDPFFWRFSVSAGEHYGDVDSNWENDAETYDVRDMPGYRAIGPGGWRDEPTILEANTHAFLRSLIESGYITESWDK